MSTKRSTYDELATFYDKMNPSRRARIQPVDTVLEWCANSGYFKLDEEGYYYLKEEKRNEPHTQHTTSLDQVL